VRAFTRDATADDLPDVGFLIPDLTHDAHSGSLSAAPGG
jgi:acid phosphatase